MGSRSDPDATPTLWAGPDARWAEVQPLLPPEKPPGTTGRPVVPFRQVLNGLLYVLRTGCQWKAVPDDYGSGSTCHRRCQQWVADGTWVRLWRDQLARYDRDRLGLAIGGQGDGAFPPSAATTPVRTRPIAGKWGPSATS